MRIIVINSKVIIIINKYLKNYKSDIRYVNYILRLRYYINVVNKRNRNIRRYIKKRTALIRTTQRAYV